MNQRDLLNYVLKFFTELDIQLLKLTELKSVFSTWIKHQMIFIHKYKAASQVDRPSSDCRHISEIPQLLLRHRI